MRRYGVFLLSWACVFFSGCGYTSRSLIQHRYKNIYVAPVENRIDITQEKDTGSKYRLYRPQLETKLTQSIIERFLNDGTLSPTDSGSGDLMLKVELIEFKQDPLRYDDNKEVIEYRVGLRVKMSLWDNRQGQKIWQEDDFGGEATYFSLTQPNFSSLDSAIDKAIADLARRIVERTVEVW